MPQPIHQLARAMGVQTHYTDGLLRKIVVEPETLLRVCATLGASVHKLDDAADALRAHHAAAHAWHLPPVVVAWDGHLPGIAVPHDFHGQASIALEDGATVPLAKHHDKLTAGHALPSGYHHLTLDHGGSLHHSTVISAPVQAFRRPGTHFSWGVGTHLAALRSQRSRSMADLKDLETLCGWIRDKGGDLVTVLPLYPTFNTHPAEPSPYSPVSRLFWSELILDLEEAHRPTGPVSTLDVTRAHEEVWAALAHRPLPPGEQLDDDMRRYARFRGVQANLGNNWRAWPQAARDGMPAADLSHAEVEQFHLKAQALAEQQILGVRARAEARGMRLGLDLAVGVHPDGYDPWSRQSLFSDGMSVGAPPDQGFPSGQDWGFAPVHPLASRREGHRYLADCIGHQARLAGVLRVDHIMAWTRLYWIPHGMGLHQGTYVSYPADELFAVLTLESHKHRCEVVGENLGTVPPDIEHALPRHRIWGMYLATFAASGPGAIEPPTEANVALVGTHDTPPFRSWMLGNDIGERLHYGLLKKDAEQAVREERAGAVERLAKYLHTSAGQPDEYFARVLEWLGHSGSPLVVPWLEDFWLEERGVNLPGTPTSQRPNWQGPMRHLLEAVFVHPDVERLMGRFARARQQAGHAVPSHT